VENLEKSRQEEMVQVNQLHAVQVSDFHQQLMEQTETSRKELERVGNSHVEVISALQHQLSEHAKTPEAIEDLKVSHLEIIASVHQQLAKQTNASQEAMEHLKQSHVAEQILMHHEHFKLEVEAAKVITLSKQMQSSDLRLEMAARQIEVLRVRL